MNMRTVNLVLLALAAILLCAACGDANAVEAEAAPPSPSPTVAATAAPTPVATPAPSPEARESTPPPALTVRYVSGAAEAERAGELSPLAQGDSLCEGDHLTTGEDGFVVLNMAGGKQLHVASGSRLKVEALRRGADGERTVLRLTQGNVVSVIDEELEEGADFEVETPGLIMAIRGTVASVRHDAQTSQSHVAMFEGEAVVRSQGSADVVEISPGEAALSSQGRLQREEILPERLHEGERRFLFDEEYAEALAGDEIWAHTRERLRDLLGRPEFADARERYQNGDAPPAGQDAPQASASQDDADDFRAIQQRFIEAKKQYEKGRLSKAEFLRIKEEYVAAKKRLNR